MRRNARGFTILEMMIAATIALMILGIGFYTITETQRVQSQSARSLRQAENARLFFDMIERDIAASYPAWFIDDKVDLVQKDSPTSPTQRYDALRFFSRLDYVNGNPDSVLLVRYYVAPADSLGRTLAQMRREVWVGNIGSATGFQSFEPTSVVDYDTVLDNVSSSVFDEVDRVRFEYRIYRPETKTFEPPLESTVDLDPALVPQATHLLVRLFLKDDGRSNQVEDQAKKKSVTNQVLPRFYQKAIPLPGTFTK